MKLMKKMSVIISLIAAMTMTYQPLMAREKQIIILSQGINMDAEVEDIVDIEKSGKLSDITLTERGIGDLTYSKNSDDRTVLLSLEGTDYSFKTLPKVTLKNGFRGKTADVSYYDKKNKVIAITLPRNASQSTRGQMIISGLSVETTSNTSSKTLLLGIGGISGDYTDVKVARLLSYGASLKVDKIYKIKKGDSRDISFTIDEGMPDSLADQRDIDIEVNKGYFKLDRYGDLEEVQVYLNGRNVTSQTDITPYTDADGKINSFSLSVAGLDDSIRDEIQVRGLRLYTDTEDVGEVKITVSGRDLENTLKEKVAEIEEASTVTVKKINAQYDLKRQEGGEIRILEEEKRSLEVGDIILSFEGMPYVEYTYIPEVEVEEGDIKVKVIGWDDDNVLRLRVIKKSTQPSVIKLSHFRFNVNKSCPDGIFGVSISGNSIIPEGGDSKITIKDFITVSSGSNSTDNNSSNNSNNNSNNSNNSNNNNNNNSNKLVTKFVLGSAIYETNGIPYTMDAVAFSQDGRTMVPVRYVAKAAGIKEEAIKYANGVITIQGSKQITLNLGSTLMTSGDEMVVMAVPPAVVNGRVYVPVSEIAKVLGIQVEWDLATQTATFIK